MPRHPLIAGYLARLRRDLPADVVDELADGLTETYDHHRARTTAPGQAARVSLAEFGTPDQVIAAFAAITPGRRQARTLLATGPLIGGCWAMALTTGHAQNWHLPVPARLVLGATLLTAIALLITAARATYGHARPRPARAGIGAVLLLDLTAVTVGPLLAPPSWPLLLAVAASLARTTLALRALLALHPTHP